MRNRIKIPACIPHSEVERHKIHKLKILEEQKMRREKKRGQEQSHHANTNPKTENQKKS